MSNRLTLDPLLVTEPAHRFRLLLRPQLPLQSEDVCDVIVKYRNGVSPSHWQGCESECSEWTLEGREVARRFGDSAFIIADEQIHHSGAGATRELFGELFGKRRNTRMRYGDCIEFFERFYPAKSAVLFRNGKPATAIG